MSDSQEVTPETASMPTDDGNKAGRQDTSLALTAIGNAIALIWRVLANPMLLLVLSGFTLLLVLAAMFFPQMPDPHKTDPAAAARWMRDMSAAYPTSGALLEATGLFNVVQSTLLRVLLFVITLMLSVQLAVQTGIALALARMPRALAAPPNQVGRPLSLGYGGDIHRQRSASETDRDQLVQTVEASLNARFDNMQQTSVANEQADTQTSDAIANETEVNKLEVCLLGMRHRTVAYLRPFLLIGLLCGLLSIWLDVSFGWEVISPSLAPDEEHLYPPRDLSINYLARVEADGAAPMIRVVAGDEEQTVAVDESGLAGRVRIVTRQSVPALLVRAQPADVILARPGAPPPISDTGTDEAEFLGLEFPQPGREETLVLPDQSVGVRIVRRPDNVYGIELYEAGSAAPARQYFLDGDEVLRVEVPNSDVALTFFPTIGAVTAVRSTPGSTLFWLAALLVLIGLLGFVRRPAFLCVQIGDWSATKSVLVLQSNLSDELDALNVQLTAPETKG